MKGPSNDHAFCSPEEQLVRNVVRAHRPVDVWCFGRRWSQPVSRPLRRHGVPGITSRCARARESERVQLLGFRPEIGACGSREVWNYGARERFTGSMAWLEIDASYIQSKIKQQNSQVSFAGLTGTLPIDETKIQLITGALHLIAKYQMARYNLIGAGPAVVHARVLDQIPSTPVALLR